MYKVDKDDESISFKVSSQLANVDRVVADICSYVAEIDNFNDLDLVQVIRELMLNAIEHGNKNDIEKVVTVKLTILAQGRFLLNIKDEGEGIPTDLFPVKGQLNSSGARSRGLILVNSLVDEVLLGRTASAIVAYITLAPKFGWGITKDDNYLLIKPANDFSATVLDELRIHLFDWLESNTSKCELCLTNVNNLDSVSLSLFIAFAGHLKEKEKEDDFIITGVSSTIMQLFKMTQISKLFTIEERIVDASWDN
jgi:anti-anti-sigma factor